MYTASSYVTLQFGYNLQSDFTSVVISNELCSPRCFDCCYLTVKVVFKNGNAAPKANEHILLYYPCTKVLTTVGGASFP